MRVRAPCECAGRSTIRVAAVRSARCKLRIGLPPIGRFTAGKWPSTYQADSIWDYECVGTQGIRTERRDRTEVVGGRAANDQTSRKENARVIIWHARHATPEERLRCSDWNLQQPLVLSEFHFVMRERGENAW